MFGWIGTVMSGLGSALTNGLRGLGSFLKNTVGGFLSKIGTTIQSGFKWLKDSVSGLFNGDAGKVAKALSEGGVKANPTPTGALSTIVLEGSDQIAAKGLDLSKAAALSSDAPMGGLTPSTIDGARLLGDQAISAIGGQTGGLKGTFKGIVDFLDTDLGGVLGKGALAFGAITLENTMKKRQFRMAQEEAKRQEENARRDWMLQQQRDSQMKSWEAERSTQVDRANTMNKWSGLTGEVWVPNNTAPAPTFAGY